MDATQGARKRMRLSSPTLDSQFGELSQEDIQSFDMLDAQLSQVKSTTNHSKRISLPAQSNEATISSANRIPSDDIILDDEENPFSTLGGRTHHETNTPHCIHASFTKASALPCISLDNDPAEDGLFSEGEPPETDYTAWFNSDSADAFVGFQTAASALKINGDSTLPAIPSSSNVSCPKGLLVPSASALQNAQEKMRKWQEDDHISSPSSCTAGPPFITAAKAFSRITPPETPTPAPHKQSAQSQSFPNLRDSSEKLRGTSRIKAFKSPLVTVPARIQSPLVPTTVTNIKSPLKQQDWSVVRNTTHSSSQLPSIPTPTSPSRTSSLANQTVLLKPLGFTPRRAGATRPKFITPFKAGVKPHQIVPSMAPSTPTNNVVMGRVYPPSVSHSLRSTKSQRGGVVFDLSPPSRRQTLASSGFRPQSYSAEELQEMGINVKELGQINLRTALFYAFNTRTTLPHESPDPSPPLYLDHAAALEELHAKGCSLATKDWTENHWPIVLWKLAGMVALDPTTESDSTRKRWCWPEVIRQLLYRYERDLNGSSRPPLRLITTRDASAESPMVLCVSNITWSIEGSDEDNLPAARHPELEVTDGWYRLRAHVDAPLTRAISKGKIKIGRKIAVIGAKLSSERKEGSEILSAYGSNSLILSGNSTHMAPWHAKLGFQKGRFIATLKSLTEDGGIIAVMMLEVVKVYPVAYVEFIHENGCKRREGPHNAKDEARLNAQWRAMRELEASKLWSEYEKRRAMMADYAERLEQRAGLKICAGGDDDPPDTIYDVYDSIQEEPSTAKEIIKSIGPQDAGWLARLIRDKALQGREDIGREIEQELQSICPPRDVRGFRVLIVKDAYTRKHPSTRRAQLTVWDTPDMSMTESSLGARFEAGQRFLVSNLIPTQTSAWMDCEVYLSTRQNSRWKRIQ